MRQGEVQLSDAFTLSLDTGGLSELMPTDPGGQSAMVYVVCFR